MGGAGGHMAHLSEDLKTYGLDSQQNETTLFRLSTTKQHWLFARPR